MHKCENSKAWGLLLNTDSCIYTWMDAGKTSICTTTEKPVKLVLSDSHSCTLVLQNNRPTESTGVTCLNSWARA